MSVVYMGYNIVCGMSSGGSLGALLPIVLNTIWLAMWSMSGIPIRNKEIIVVM